MKFYSTIAACSTGFPAAIAVIRISGEKTEELLKQCFFSDSAVVHREMRVGRLEFEGIKDTATAVFYKAPLSYTGEDMVEISIHGSRALAQKLLLFLIRNGARAAERGEFTKRAFLNGKLDLSSAEGVLNIINAETDSELKLAYAQMKGEIKQAVENLQKNLTLTIAAAEAVIDFPEEDLEQQAKAEIKESVISVLSKAETMLDGYSHGRLVKEGIRVAIAGSVNVGKSSLMNALLKKERAIVTEIPGTTRDTVEDRYEYNGYKFVVTDTAGIRQTGDRIEKLGIERSVAALKESDIVLVVTEAGKKKEQEEPEMSEIIRNISGKIIEIENKTDIYKATGKKTVKISAKTGENIENLKKKIYDLAVNEPQEGVIITDLRHYEALLDAKQALSAAIKNINFVTMDCLAADLMAAYNSLGKITGVIGSDEIIDEIFSNFCVGK